ncbi:MAG: peptidylprolyl isomerase [Clostridiales bacterium]|nr:peptidylprolyl isomerase [Clostridiales bacterium]
MSNDTLKEELQEERKQEVEYQFEEPKKGDTVAVMKTNHGDIKIRLFKDIAPKTVENFVGLANKGYYNGVTFHRVIKDFMIQGGDPTGTGAGGDSIWNIPFEDEFSNKVHHYRGALSMANRGPDTNTSQFFIVHNKRLEPGLITYLKKMNFDENLLKKYVEYGGTPHLDGKHTIFGQVYEGIEVVDKIANVEVSSYGNNKPLEDVVILEVTIENI